MRSSAGCHCTTGDPHPKPEVTRRDLSVYLERARLRLGVQVKEIAFFWNCDHGYVSRVLSNKDPLPDHRIAQLPDALRLAVLEEWAADEGLLTGRKAALLKAVEGIAALATDDRLDVSVRMAKADLR
jgi:hypothetical protein